MNPTIEAVDRSRRAGSQEAPEVLRLMTHPGVGPITALAFVTIIGTPERFPCGKQIGSYVGLIPRGELQRWTATAGTHQQARQLTAALFVGGGGTGGGALRPGLAASVPTSGDASRTSHRQSGHGQKTGGSVVLDVAERLGVCAVGRVRFARGTARNRTWRALERRPLDWASRSLARGRSKK